MSKVIVHCIDGEIVDVYAPHSCEVYIVDTVTEARSGYWAAAKGLIAMSPEVRAEWYRSTRKEPQP